LALALVVHGAALDSGRSIYADRGVLVVDDCSGTRRSKNRSNLQVARAP
jgi:hypothetical protein